MNIIKSYNKFGIIVIFVVTILINFNCKPENNSTSKDKEVEQIRKSMGEFSDKSTEYRSFPAEIRFFDPVTEKNDPQTAIRARKDFIKQSGLPDDSNVDDFKTNKTVDIAYKLYDDYILKNTESPYIKTFKQYGAWVILTRLDLLGMNSKQDLEMTYELLNNLIETNYEGFQLVSYGINHLYINNFSNKEIKNLCVLVLQYASYNTNAENSNVKQRIVPETNSKPLPPEIVESLKNYNEKKKANKQIAIDQIRELLSKL